MQTHPDTGLGEAFASYQPTSIDKATWSRFRDDALELVARLGRTPAATRPVLSRLVAFLAAVADDEPDATLTDLLTPDRVQGYLDAVKAAGENPGTLLNRQGSLNALLAELAPAPDGPTVTNPDHAPLTPHGRDELLDAVDRAVRAGGTDAETFAMTVLAGLVGGAVPPTGGSVTVETDGTTVTVAGHTATVPDGIALPPSGTLHRDQVDAGRHWAATRLGAEIDLRRLELAFVTHAVATWPALDSLALPGVGRRRLDAAVAASQLPCPARLRRQLRCDAAG